MLLCQHIKLETKYLNNGKKKEPKIGRCEMRFRETAGGSVVEGGRGGHRGPVGVRAARRGTAPDRGTQSNLCVSDPSSVRR